MRHALACAAAAPGVLSMTSPCDSLLSPVMPGNPNSETDLQGSESRRHKCIAPGRRRKERRSPENHQAKTHDRNDAHGKRATWDDSSSIEQQPPTGKHTNSSRGVQGKGQQSANDDWRGKAEQKFAPWAGQKSRIRAVGFGGRSRRGDCNRDKSFHEPDREPGARRRLACRDEGGRERRNAHSHAAPSGDGGKLRGALHGFANVFEMIGGASVDGDGLVLVRPEGAGG